MRPRRSAWASRGSASEKGRRERSARGHESEEAAPETACRERVFRLLTPRHALEIALAAAKRARDFFEATRRGAPDPAVRSLAREMLMEENEHIHRLLKSLARLPAALDWEKLSA